MTNTIYVLTHEQMFDTNLRRPILQCNPLHNSARCWLFWTTSAKRKGLSKLAERTVDTVRRDYFWRFKSEAADASLEYSGRIFCPD
jgi:hypothetical protein